MIRFNTDAMEPVLGEALEAKETLVSGTGKGREYTGWVRLPECFDKEEYARLKVCAEKIYEDGEALVVIGIGGSYLGARAAIEAILSHRYNETGRKGPKVYFAGNGIDGEDLLQILELVKGKSLYVNVISKSGTTLEPALAFRFFRQYIEEAYGKEEAKNRIICTTDKAKGTLKALADAEGYQCFAVPDDIGGRYSVLTPVGLLPMAACSIDIDAMMTGAKDQMTACLGGEDDALRYAALRQQLYRQGKKAEVFSVFGESYRFFAEWWKQLFGESEGKDLQGIFPASCVYTADLHSMGQYMQQGDRMLMETFLSVGKDRSQLSVTESADSGDGLGYLTGKAFEDIRRCALEGTREAHAAGGVPCMTVTVPKIDAYWIGALFYFFEFSCGISAYMQGANPFDQPGVEEYKKNMFRLLGK